MRKLALTLVPLLLLACERQPTALDAGPSFSNSGPATVTRGTETYSYDQVHYWACVGEMVHNQFQVTYRYTLVVLPSGDYVFRDLWPSGALGTITGLSSGTVWVRQRTSGPDVVRSTGGGMVMFTTNAWFVSETGPTIHVRQVYHVSGNAHGEVKVDFMKADCKVM